MAVLLTKVNISCMLFFILFSTFSHVALLSEEPIEEDSSDIEWLKPNQRVLKKDNAQFKIFCFNSISKSIVHLWRSVHLSLENVPSSLEVFPGVNETDVRNKLVEKSVWYTTSWFSGQKTTVDFPAFSKYCVGISTTEKYAIQLNVRTVNYWRVLQFIIGLLLFLSAPSLSRNPFFHYTSGVSLGVLGSVLVIIYIISRFIPKKSTSYAVLFFGYSFILYIFQILWKDMNEIISGYMDVLLAYCLCAAVISFLVCYRFGPVTNVRTFNIIQWSMQVIAALLIYLSSEYREVSTAVILVLIGIKIIPTSWIKKLQRIWYCYFPPKVRLLTELEYIEQGHIETKEALENLRKYCSSPDCNVWKTITRLKDPLRFADFIESGSQCSDQELLRYNSEGFSDFTDDEEDSQPSTSSYMGNGHLSHS